MDLGLVAGPFMWDFDPSNRSNCVGFYPSKAVKVCGTGHIDLKKTYDFPKSIYLSITENFSNPKE